MLDPNKPTVTVTITEDEFDFILKALEYTAKHKYKKDGLQQVIIADFASRMEDEATYSPALNDLMNEVHAITEAMKEWTND